MVLVLNQLVFHLLVHMIWGFVVRVLTPVYVRRHVSDVVPSVPDVGTQKPGYVPPLPMSYYKSIIAEMGYTKDVVENAWSINNCVAS